MFHWLYEIFVNDFGFFRIFSYVTFRALMAGLTSMIISFIFGKKMIDFLKKLKFRESVRSDGPVTHEAKQGTPTMGGLMIIFSLITSVLLWANLSNNNILLLTSFSLFFALLGFTDDYKKSVLKVKGGMKARSKFIITIFLSLAFSVIFLFFTAEVSDNQQKGINFLITDLFVPFIKGPVLNLGIFAIPFYILVIIGTSHAVNLTDGLDGLASGTVLVSVTTLGLIAYVSGTPVAANYLNIAYLPGSHEYSVFLAALAGSLLGFLWYNTHPAEVFMGDTGSLFLGATLGMTAIMLKKEILLVILGFVFVMEALSVIIQVAYYKRTKKRIFKMAPLHHHFELAGLKETKIVIRFWIVSIIFAIIAFSSLKIQ